MSNVTREKIIESLRAKLEPLPKTYAMWLEGADASGDIDEYSDLDLWFDVDDDFVDVAFEEIEAALSELAPLDFKEVIPNHPHPKIRQRIYHLKGTSEFLLIDVCVQLHSRQFWFTKGHKGEETKVIFDKSNVIQYRERDEGKFQNELKEQAKALVNSFPFDLARVRKELHRGHFLEALVYYHKYILEPLVELLRIRHEPTKREFYLKHISRDLPADVVKQLEKVYAVSSLKDIEAGISTAEQIFRETSSELKLLS